MCYSRVTEWNMGRMDNVPVVPVQGTCIYKKTVQIRHNLRLEPHGQLWFYPWTRPGPQFLSLPLTEFPRGKFRTQLTCIAFTARSRLQNAGHRHVESGWRNVAMRRIYVRTGLKKRISLLAGNCLTSFGFSEQTLHPDTLNAQTESCTSER